MNFPCERLSKNDVTQGGVGTWGGGQLNGDDMGGKGKGKDDNIPHVY